MTDEKPAPRRSGPRAAAILIGVLVAALGFALAVQVQANGGDVLSGLRDQDLIRILDDQNARADRLEQQVSQLRAQLAALQQSGTKDEAARQQAQQEAQDLAILLGTTPATGPGVDVGITDPGHALKAEDLLDVIEELRGAGAETIQFGPVRVTTSTALQDRDGGISIDGTALAPPYRVLAIGDPATLDTALNIPGGVAATVRAAGGDLTVQRSQTITIDATVTLATPQYAKPSK